MMPGSQPIASARRLPPWIWSRPFGLLAGLLGVSTVTGVIALFDSLVTNVPNPSLPYTLLILVVAFGWGGRVGFSIAVVTFLTVWYLFIPESARLLTGGSSDWTRLVLIAFTYGAMALVGDSFRRLLRANARLGGTVERLNAVIASIADGVLVLDRDGNLLQTNDAMRRIHGGEVPLTLAERSAVWGTHHPDGSPLVHGSGPTTAALKGAIVTGYDVVIRNAVGRELPISVSSAPVRGPGGGIVGAVIVCRDVSEVRRLQQAKDDFLSIASHELKTPLTSLRGYAQLLRQRVMRAEVADDRVLRYLTTIDTQTRRMAELVDTLLDVSRLDAGRLQLRAEPFDLVALARETANQLGDLSSRHTITVTADTPTLIGDWDRDRIEQIIVNLLTNAIRYSPDGGPITVTIGTRLAEDEVAAGTGHGAGEAFVQVRDQGLGIPPDQLQSVFERFYRAHEEVAGYAEAQRGMGLGLFISRELAERHGGYLRAESDGPGHGATFTLTLPLQPVAAVRS